MPSSYYFIEELCIKCKEDFFPAEQFGKVLTWGGPFQFTSSAWLCGSDMLGLIGAATVVGSLMYGVGICWRQELELHYQQEEAEGSIDDVKMINMLKGAGPISDLPPLALAEIVHVAKEEFIVRRLHLIIVDTWRQKLLPHRNVAQLRSAMREEPEGPRTRNTTPIRLTAKSGRHQHQVRFVYGHALDGSTFPCYCLYPVRAEDHSFQLMDSATGYIAAIPQAASIRPLGVAHFYDAFSTNHELDIRDDALRTFGLPEAAINADLSVVVPWANQILPAAGPARKVPAEEDDNDSVVSVASSNARVAKPEGDTDSDASVASEGNTTTEVVDLVTDEDESDEESEEDFELSEKEQRFLQEAYDIHANTGDAWTQQRTTSTPSCRTPFADAGNVQAAFEDFAKLPDGWPLMRILIPLDGLSLQIERIVICVAAELVATHRSLKTQTKFAKRVAKKLTAILACYLANEVASMVSPVATVDNKEMVAPMYQPFSLRFVGSGQSTLSCCTPLPDYGKTPELRLPARPMDW